MKRILVIGSGGAGKSTFAKRLGEILELKVIHLDSLFWSSGWVEMPKDQWRAMVEELMKGDSWILDGNYGGTLDLRLAACDAVIFLDIPRMTCLKRVFKRRMSNRKQSRPDMAPGCPERINWEFIKYIWDYPRTGKPAVLKKIESCSETKKVAILKSQADTDGFLAKLAISLRPSNAKFKRRSMKHLAIFISTVSLITTTLLPVAQGQTRRTQRKKKPTSVAKPINRTANSTAAVTTPSGLVYIITKHNNGRYPVQGETVVVNYTGLLSNGVKFDSSFDRGQPFKFKLGLGRVIKGWDEGIQKIRVGEQATLVIPASLGYGAEGSGDVIPPNATLIFVVELLDIESAKPQTNRRTFEGSQKSHTFD